MYKNLSHLSIAARGGDVVFVSSLLSLPDATFQAHSPSYGSPMQLLKGEVDRFRELTLYVRAFRHIDSAVVSVVVVKS